jgi:hypothetical protein
MKLTVSPMNGGRWKVFSPPVQRYHYVVAVDAASGKEGANESVAQVLCIENGKQCAVLAGLINPDIMAFEAEKAGYLYNEAIIAVERELHGQTIINALKGRGYPNIYFHIETMTSMGGMSTREYGWNARQYRQTAIDWLQQDIGYSASKKPEEKNKAVFVYDPDTINQLGYFIRNKSTGKMEAASGKYDDRVSALYIANFVRREKYEFYMTPEEKPREKTFLDILAHGSDDPEGMVNLGED